MSDDRGKVGNRDNPRASGPTMMGVLLHPCELELESGRGSGKGDLKGVSNALT